jgi:predicted RNA binding protein YcfA (HicA-like mRNA interferase family)
LAAKNPLKSPNESIYFIHIPTWASRELIKMLTDDGWYQCGQAGSHAQYRHNTKPGRVTLVVGKKELPMGTVASHVLDGGIVSLT